MPGQYESIDKTLERRRRMQSMYPEMVDSDPTTILKVDAYTSASGGLPSRFTQDMVSTANESARARAIQTAVEQASKFRSRFTQAQGYYDQLQTQEAAAGPLGLDLSGPYAGNVLPVAEDGNAGSISNVLTLLDRPRGALFGAIDAVEKGDPLASIPEGVMGAVRGFQDPRAYQGRDAVGIRALPDEDVVGSLSPRDIAGGTSEVLFDPLDLATGGFVATDAVRLASQGIRRFSDDAAQAAVRAAQGPLEASTRGIIDQAPRAIPGSRVAGGADELLGSQSEAVRRYAQAQEKAGEPVRAGVVSALEQASAAVRTDPQGAVSRIAGNIPGLRTIRDWDRPGLTMERNILEGHIAKRGVESSLLTEQGVKRVEAIRAIDDVFGEGATTGGRILDNARMNVDELHKVNGVEYPASGTVYDAMQRPYAYDLTPDQMDAIRVWSDTDDALRVRLNDEYGADVGKFVPERGGVYVQNINRSEARQAQLEALARNEARTISGSGQSKTRVYESGFDRWKNNVGRGLDPERVFVPETDLNVLGYTSDLSKANTAGDLTFRAAVGGKTISEVKEEVAPALVKLRDQMRTDIDSIRGRITRAEQSAGRDTTVARRLETQAGQTTRRADELASREPFEQFEQAISELDRRAAELSRAASGPAGRADLARQGIESLRDDLATLKEQYADVKRAYDAVDPQDYVQVKSLPGRYFPTKEAAQLEELSRPAKDNVITRGLEGWRSQVLAGDIGPLTGIQGLILAASGRAGVTKAVAGSLADMAKTGDFLAPFRSDAMQQFIRENADIVDEFSFYTGRNVGGRLPAEIGQGGVLAKIPGFTDANEAMFNVVTRRQIEMFRRVKEDLIKAGYSNNEAAAAAGDLSSKVVPLMTTSRLGQSAAKAQEQRFLPTSLGFIRQPLALTEEAFTGLGKMAAGQTLTPRQKIATAIYTQFIGNIIGISVTSALVNAIAQGDDPVSAVQDALNPSSRAFMAVSAGDTRVPLANPFRAPLRVGLNNLKNTLNLGVEPLTGKDISATAGDSIVDYATGRIGPPIRAIGDAYGEITSAPWEREYQGESDILRLLSAGAMLAGGAAPIPAQGIYEEVQEQREAGEFDPVGLAGTALAETASFSLIPAEDRRILDSKAQQAFDAPFSELDRQQKRMVLLANPDLTDEARDDVRTRMEETGYRAAADRAWGELAPEFNVTQDYDAYRDALRAELEAEGLERTVVDKALRTDPLIVAYNDLRRGFEYEWIAENAEGLAVEAYDFGLIPDNEAIRAMLALTGTTAQ